ncbi:MAG: PmoA family protein [Planctomycetaceae bacterium]|nr:PmoA family protein [Planctomycetaceae bacterium]
MKNYILFISLCLFLSVAVLQAGEVSLQKTDFGCEIKIDGALFAGYRTDCNGTPIIYPIVGPTGKKMTRDFPMNPRDDNSEAKDHPHHRSFWFNHGAVNGLDFWALKQPIVHKQFVKSESNGKTAVIETKNDWLDKDSKPLCSDTRKFTFGELKGKNGIVRYIDADITVKAEQDEVVFGDTKEGSFGIRVAGTMDLTAKKRNPDWGGNIVNAEGIKDGETWAKRSDWVDYFGPVEGETVGIAIMNHPSSFRYPTYWHVRDYGLFAANPFGEHDFQKKTEHTGELKMKKGDTFTVKYRVIFHKGSADEAGIKELFEEYKK